MKPRERKGVVKEAALCAFIAWCQVGNVPPKFFFQGSLYSFSPQDFLYFEVKNQVNLWPRISKSPDGKSFPFCCLLNEKLSCACRTQNASVEKTRGLINSELQIFWIILFRRRHPH